MAELIKGYYSIAIEVDSLEYFADLVLRNLSIHLNNPLEELALRDLACLIDIKRAECVSQCKKLVLQALIYLQYWVNQVLGEDHAGHWHLVIRATSCRRLQLREG